MQEKTEEKVEKAIAGDIVATIKLKGTQSSHTLVKSGDEMIAAPANILNQNSVQLLELKIILKMKNWAQF